MSIRQIAAAIVATAILGLLAPASLATAADAETPQPISFASTSQTVTVGTAPTITLDVGDWWSTLCVDTADGTCDPSPLVDLVEEGQDEPLVAGVPVDGDSVRIDTFDLVQTLHAGTHLLQAECEAPFTCATTTPLTLRIDPAPLLVDGRVQTDDAHPRGAVVTALISGDVLDTYAGCDCALDPAGTWTIEVRDHDDKAVVTRSITVTAGEGRDTSFYWNDVPRDAEFTATFAFTPSGAHPDDFTVTSDDITYASPAATTAIDPSAPDPSAQTPDRTLARTHTLPLWLLVAAGMLGLAMLIATAVLVIRLALGPVLVIRRDVLDDGSAS